MIFTIGLIILQQFLKGGPNTILRFSGVVLLLLATPLIFWPFYLLNKYGRVEQGKQYMHTMTVVDRGLYAVVRHPQYLGYMLLTFGFMLISQHGIIAMLGVIAVLFYYLHAREEERYIVSVHGRAYERYMDRVPRFNVVTGLYRRIKGIIRNEPPK
jgi:protein-S-isoprenylcysteine O-methyltransferase Ste14